ncbi:MAG: glycosyltransferase family 4 protein [Firmicutes bacterium]|nr:glycosyltransferase family 4 protein [Bacillota bacterium]
MRVGITTLAFAPGLSGGDGTYVRHLVRALSTGLDGLDAPSPDAATPGARAGSGEPAHYVLFAAPWNAAALAPLGPRATLVVCPVPPGSFVLRALWEQLALPRLLARANLDVFHAPVNVAPLGTPCPLVLTLHEHVPFAAEVRMPVTLRGYWRLFRRASARRAAAIIAVSRASAAALIRAMQLPPAKVRVIHHGLAPVYLEAGAAPPVTPAAPAAAAADPAPPLPGLAPGYLLWVGRTYPSKNVPVLLQAFQRLVRHMPARLVLVGRPGWDEPRVARLVQQLGLAAHVVRLGPCDAITLRRLYRHAAALAFPSTHESFGFPVLEAMACGTPVVAARLPCLEEIAGDVPLYVAPHDIGGWAAALAATLAAWRAGSPALQERRAAGMARARRFRWEQTALATAQVYQQVYQTAAAAAAPVPAHRRGGPSRP